MAVQFGTSQMCKPAPMYIQILEAVIFVAAVLIFLIVTPMPDEWLKSDIKVYLLAVSGGSSMAISKLKEFSGKKESEKIESPPLSDIQPPQ